MTTNNVAFMQAFQTIKEAIPQAVWMEIDWARVLQIVQQAIPLLSDIKGNFFQLFALAKELFDLFTKAEQQANHNFRSKQSNPNYAPYAIDWSKLISILLPILLELIGGIGKQDNYHIVRTHSGTYQLPIGPNDKV